jgi:hypothetical protein
MRRRTSLARRHDLSRNLIRIWVQKHEAGAFDDEGVVRSCRASARAHVLGLEADFSAHLTAPTLRDQDSETFSEIVFRRASLYCVPFDSSNMIEAHYSAHIIDAMTEAARLAVVPLIDKW